MQIHSVGIDLGKTTFHLVALGRSRQGAREEEVHAEAAADVHREHADFADRLGSLFRSALSRSGVAEARPRCAADPAQFVKPFVKSNKNDFVDAEAIAEAVERKNMRFVPIKTDDQLDLQAIHRVRDRLISRRTAVINQLRAFLLERGMVFAQTPAKLKAAMADILENAEAI
jgi:transposase